MLLPSLSVVMVIATAPAAMLAVLLGVATFAAAFAALDGGRAEVVVVAVAAVADVVAVAPAAATAHTCLLVDLLVQFIIGAF